MFPAARLFVDIVQQRSISRGAQLNRISQSAASQQLFELERQLEIQLLDRTTRPVAPTPAGKLYFDLSRDILRREEEFAAALETLRPRADGRVRITSIYSVGLTDLPWHREEFQARFPAIDIILSLSRPDAVYTALLEDRADLGVASYPEPGRDFVLIPWREEPMAVVLPAGHPLSRRTALSPLDLDGLPFIAFDEDLPIRRHIDRYLRDFGVSVNITFHVDNSETLKACVASGSGISILPETTGGPLVTIPLTEPLLRPVGILYRRGKALNRAAHLFIERLLSHPDPRRQSADPPTPASDPALETVHSGGGSD